MDWNLTGGPRWERGTRLLLVLGALCLATTACQREARGQLSAEQSAEAVQALTTWFECEECEAGELEAVRKYGEAVIPSLIAVLNGGLSPASREQMRQQLEVRYDELAGAALKDPNAKLASNKEQFTALYLGNFDALYRVRAAQALAAIGGNRARSALEDALQSSQRVDVQEMIKKSLSTMK